MFRSLILRLLVGSEGRVRRSLRLATHLWRERLAQKGAVAPRFHGNRLLKDCFGLSVSVSCFGMSFIRGSRAVGSLVVEHRTPERKARVRCPMPSNTLRVHTDATEDPLRAAVAQWSRRAADWTPLLYSVTNRCKQTQLKFSVATAHDGQGLCVYPSFRDHWALWCMSRCPDQVVSLKRDPQCFKSPCKLGTHLSAHCNRDERLSRPCPVRE
ncbi:hypothetical protein TNCV_5104961 [Trichonephila clavipes]|nr:hypothetical protein TNCV_5104961 [Trichonephila clavipes]